MKNLFYLILFSLSLVLTAFTSNDYAKNVKLSVELDDTKPTDSLFLYQFEGFGFSKIHSSANKEGTFLFKLPKSKTQFFYLGNDPKQLKPILLGTEPEILVKGSISKMANLLVSSKVNQDYENLKKELGKLKQETALITQEFQKTQNDLSAQNMAIFKMSEVDDKRMKLLEEYRSKEPILGEVAAINTYLSFHNNSGDYYSEIDYFANEFFQFTDFKNPYYVHNPWVFEAFKEYTENLASINLDADLIQSYIDDALSKVPANSHTYQLALTGVSVALDARKNKLFTLYGKRLVKKYEKAHPKLLAGLKTKVLGASAFIPGAVAPDFAQQTPDGKTLKLSDLRGKVVLVDFWASWCGPCRRENPNVKKVYEKYKDKGFEILGVSLDRTKASWEKAIEQDGLPWHHVSDLKGWKNEVAAMYSVSSIPHTILLDQEGKIIVSKLRGAQLEQVLGEIFGE